MLVNVHIMRYISCTRYSMRRVYPGVQAKIASLGCNTRKPRERTRISSECTSTTRPLADNLCQTKRVILLCDYTRPENERLVFFAEQAQIFPTVLNRFLQFGSVYPFKKSFFSGRRLLHFWLVEGLYKMKTT